MPVTKNYIVKEASTKKSAAGLVLVVSVTEPPKTIGGITIPSPQPPLSYEVPTSTATLLADLAAYGDGNVVPVTFGAPVAPAAPAAASTAPPAA